MVDHCNNILLFDINENDGSLCLKTAYRKNFPAIGEFTYELRYFN